MAITKKKQDKAAKRSNAKSWVTQTDESSGWSPTYFKPAWKGKTLGLFKFREAKKYRLDFMGFLAGDGNPRAPKGQIHFERTVYVHNDVGPKKEKHCCLIQTFGRKKCPICDHTAKLRRAGTMDEKEIRKMDPKMRHLWVLKDLDKPELGWQVFETGHFKTFGEQMKDKLDALDDDSPALDFFMPDSGMSLVIKTKEDSFEGRTFYAAGNIDFIPRRKQYDEDFAKKVPCPDEMLVELSYDELKELFEGNTDDDEDDEKPSKKKKGKKTDDDEEDLEDEDDDDDTESDGDEGDGESGSESDDEDEDSDDEEGDEEADDDGEEDEEGEEDAAIEVGDVVSWGKGKKKVEGRVMKVKAGKVTFTDDDDEEYKKPEDECTIVSKAEDEAEDSDDEEEEPAPKKKGKDKPKSKKKDEEEEEEDDEPFDDDDLNFDDDEEEEEEEEDEPPAKKKGKK